MAGNSLGTLTLDLVARIGRFVQPLQDAERQTRQSAQRINNDLRFISDGVKSMLTSFAGIGVIYSAMDAADKFTGVRNKLVLVTNSQNELNAAMQMSFDIAQRTGSSWEGVSTIYQRFAQNADRLGLSQQKVASITETVSKALSMSGGSIESQNAAIMQFSQGLGSGVLRGEEFNSVMEGGLGLAQALATGLNVPIGMLRGMAEQGELTSDVLVSALGKAAKKVEDDYNKTTTTIGQGFQKVRDAYTKFVGESNGGGAAALAGALGGVAKNLDLIANAGAAVAVGYVAKSLAGMSIAAYQSVAATMESIKADEAAIAQRIRKANQEYNAAQAEMSKARAAVLSAEMQVAADRTVIASEINRLKSTQTQLVAEKALEVQRFRAQISDQGRAASVSRMATLRQTEALIIKELQVAEAQLASTTVASSAAYNTARNAQTLATERLAAANLELGIAQRATTASSFGLLGALGGPAGLIGITAMLAAGFYLMRDSTDDAGDALDWVGMKADEAKEKFLALNNAQRAYQVDKLKAELAEQDKALAAANTNLRNLIQNIAEFSKQQGFKEGGKEAAAVLKELDSKAIDAATAYERLNGVKFHYDEWRTGLNKLGAEVADNTDKSKALGGRLKELTGYQHSAAAAAKDHTTQITNQSKALQDYLNKTKQGFINSKVQLALQNKGYSPAQAAAISEAQAAIGFSDKKDKNGKLLANALTEQQVNFILQGVAAQDELNESTNQYNDLLKKNNKEESDAEKKTKREKEQRQDAFKSYLESLRSEPKVIEENYKARIALINEFAADDLKLREILKNRAEQQKQDDLAKYRIATQDKLNSYTEYAQTEEQLVKRHYDKLRAEAKIDDDLRRQKKTAWAVEQLNKEEQLELDKIRRVNEQDILQSKAAYMTKLQFMQASYGMERKDINAQTGKSQDWKDAMLTGVNAQESNGFYGESEQAWSDWEGAGFGSKDKFKGLQSEYDTQLEIVNRNEKLINITHEEAARKRLQIEKDYNKAKYSLVAESGANIAGSMADSTKTLFGEQSKAYKKMLKVQQAFALAQAIINVPKTASEAYAAMAGIPYVGPVLGVAAAAAAIAAQAAQVAAIRGTQLPTSGFYDGGFTGYGGKYEPAGTVHRGEVVWSQQNVRDAGGVGNVEALRTGKLNKTMAQARECATVQVTVNNYAAVDVKTRTDGNGVTVDVVERMIADKAPAAAANALYNPNSELSKSLQANTTAGRQR